MGRDVVGGALKGQRDPGPVAPQALPGVITVLGGVLTQQTGVELCEGERVRTVENDRVEVADGNDCRSVVMPSSQSVQRRISSLQSIRRALRAGAADRHTGHIDSRRRGRAERSDGGGLIAAAAAKIVLEARLDRVKICPADDCRWAFYDPHVTTLVSGARWRFVATGPRPEPTNEMLEADRP